MKTLPEIWKVTVWQESPTQVRVRIENETTPEVLGTFHFDLDPEQIESKPLVIQIARAEGGRFSLC